jgi:hypothetical protein
MKIVLLTALMFASTVQAQSTSDQSLFGGSATQSGSPSHFKLSHAPNRSVTSLKSFKDVHKQLQQSPYKLSYSQNHNFSPVYDSRSNGEYFKTDFVVHDAFLAYNINRQNDIRLSPRVTTDHAERAHTETTFRHVEFRYRRNRILEQDKHGISLSAQNRQIYNVDEKWRNGRGADGLTRTQVDISKSFNSLFSIDMSFINFFNYRNTSNRQTPQSSTRAKYLNRIIFSPNLQFNDYVAASFGTFYDSGHIDDEYAERVHTAKSDDIIYIDPSINFVLTSWLNVDLDWGHALYRSHDDRHGILNDGWYSRDNNNRVWGTWVGATFNFSIF